LAALADGTLVAVTGMGNSAAAAGSRALIEAGATALASWGMAGGLDPTLSAGAILLPTEVIGSDGQCLNTAAAWLNCSGLPVPRLWIWKA
jgi:adenosylhomocysteine nucleosidase